MSDEEKTSVSWHVETRPKNRRGFGWVRVNGQVGFSAELAASQAERHRAQYPGRDYRVVRVTTTTVVTEL
jgi:hypothetical protein